MSDNLIGQITPSVEVIGQIGEPIEIVAIVQNGAKGKDGLTVSVNKITQANGDITIDSNDIKIDKDDDASLTIKEAIDAMEQKGDKAYTHVQMMASNIWTINHPLEKYPSVTVIDTSGNLVIGDIQYLSNSELILTFSAEFSGTAYLN